MPLDVLQTPARWQASGAAQTTGAPAQAPALQASAVVQGLPSSQGSPLAFGSSPQVPVSASQTEFMQGVEGTQTTGLAPVQVPLTQLSVWVQRFASLQVVPSGAKGSEHCPVVLSQVPATWQASSAEQTTGSSPVQLPA